jgi:hypothetical protein
MQGVAVGDALHCGPDALDRAVATVLAGPR